MVRKEQKTITPMSINKFEEAISKGFNEQSNAQANFELKQAVNGNSEALKYTNSRLLGFERILEGVFKSKVTDLEKTKFIEKEVLELRVDVNRLADSFCKLTTLLTNAANPEDTAQDPKSTAAGGAQYVS